jgi:ferritin-like metal-binding protein YciE
MKAANRGKPLIPVWFRDPNHFHLAMISNLEALYHLQLRDLCSAETQLIAALPDMADAATNEDLRRAFSDHLAETKVHLDRLTDICANHGIQPAGEACKAMKGLLVETREHLRNTTPGELRDAALIACANRIEHYEIAGYGVTRAFAEVLGFDDAADLLGVTLDEEAIADSTLTDIATGGMFRTGINEEAIR